MLPADWIGHRRADGEMVGWIVPDGDLFRVRDLLGRDASSDAMEWLDAEETLEALGIGYLADRYVLRLSDGSERPVRIVEVSARGITVAADEFGAASAVGAVREEFRLAFPVPPDLRTASR